MDKTIPPYAAHLLDFIGKLEAPKGYGTIIGNNQDKLAKPLTSMTLDEVLVAQRRWADIYESSAAGRYQFIRATLSGLKKELKLTGRELFTPDLQDRLAMQLLLRRGYKLFVDGKLGVTAFALRLAQEWASLPVLASTSRNGRTILRGQSYYAGVGSNKSLTKAGEFEKVIRTKLPGTLDAAPAAQPTPTPPPVCQPAPAQPASAGFFVRLIRALYLAFGKPA